MKMKNILVLAVLITLSTKIYSASPESNSVDSNMYNGLCTGACVAYNGLKYPLIALGATKAVTGAIETVTGDALPRESSWTNPYLIAATVGVGIALWRAPKDFQHTQELEKRKQENQTLIENSQKLTNNLCSIEGKIKVKKQELADLTHKITLATQNVDRLNTEVRQLQQENMNAIYAARTDSTRIIPGSQSNWWG